MMKGTNRIATIATRVGGQWVDSGETLTCRLQAISPTMKIQNERYYESTHLVIGEPTPVLNEGMRLTISGENYFIAGAQKHNRPGTGEHHQEIWTVRAE